MNIPKATGYQVPRAPHSPLRRNLLSLCVLFPRWLNAFGMRLKHYLPVVQVLYLGSFPSWVCRVSERQFVLVVHVRERATDSKPSTGKSEVGSQMTDEDMADSVFSCLCQGNLCACTCWQWGHLVWSFLQWVCSSLAKDRSNRRAWKINMGRRTRLSVCPASQPWKIMTQM